MMCDSFVVLPPHTENNDTLIGKISDMDVNVAYGLRRIKHKKILPGLILRTTHICIPQVETTYDVVMCGYDHIWGTEMGINEYGLAIGDEAQFTKVMLLEHGDGIISMDFNRIVLERAKNCREAIKIITSLLEEYGQGGNCSLYGNFHLDGSYLLADPHEAWILQTAGRKWAAKRVQSFDTISNCLQPTKGWEMISEDKLDLASENQDVAVPFGQSRQQITYSFIESRNEPFTLRNAFQLLRFHKDNFDVENQSKSPECICMHGFNFNNQNSFGGNSAWVGQLNPKNGNLGWFTITGGICLSIFKPVYPGVELPKIIGPMPSHIFDPKTLWWKHELIHRRVLADFNNLMPEIRADFDIIEREFMDQAPKYLQACNKDKQGYMEYCFQKANQAENRWIAKLSHRKFTFQNAEYGSWWKRYNQEAGISGLLE